MDNIKTLLVPHPSIKLSSAELEQEREGLQAFKFCV